MKTRIYLVALLLAVASLGQAQKKEWKYNSIVQAGLLEGEQGSAFQLQTVQGVKYKTWSAGIGVGLDYYHTRSVPLFLDLRKSFCNKEKSAFVYAAGGYNFLWPKESDADTYEFLTDSKGGLYYDAGIGYQLPVFKTQQLLFSAGFSQKNFSKTATMPYLLLIWPPPPQAYEEYSYVVRRLSVKIGLRF